MKKYRCGKCGMTFEGKLEVCPGCGVTLHYVDSEIRLQSENAIKENSVSTFRFDDDDVIKTGIPENEDDLPLIQDQFFHSKHALKGKEQDLVIRRSSRRYPKEMLLSEELSYFDGRKLVSYFMKIGLFFLAIITAFIGVPWCVTIKYRWETKHTVLCGYRLAFDGTGKQLFGRYILWLFLSIITAGIFLFWLTHFLKKWKIKHTVILKKDA